MRFRDITAKNKKKEHDASHCCSAGTDAPVSFLETILVLFWALVIGIADWMDRRESDG